MKAPLIQNETDYDGRTVNSIVRFVFRELELDGRRVMVKVKMLREKPKCYSGRAYLEVWSHGGSVYDYGTETWRDIRPNVPGHIDHLVICRIGPEHFYPRENYVYKRKDSPGKWLLADWREALVSVCAHEAMHVRQYRTHPKGKRGRFNEVQTEWAAFRLWREWRRQRKLPIPLVQYLPPTR